jgi:uncharacterized damage-inducible protein DinB
MNRKEEIIAGLIEARRQILDAVSTLSLEKQDEVFLGSWSVKDLLAHLVGWDYANIDAAKEIRAGKPPHVLEHWDPDWVKYNAELVRRYKRDNWVEQLDTIQQSHKALIEMVRTIPSEDIEKDFGVRSTSGANVTVEDFLQFEIEDESRHYQQIQDWLK